MHVVERTDGRYRFTSAVNANPGDVIVRPDNTLAVLDGLDAVKIGDEIMPSPLIPTNIVWFDVPSASTWAAAAVLYWDNVAKAVTTTSAGNTRIGVATTAKTNGQTTHRVNCTPA